MALWHFHSAASRGQNNTRKNTWTCLIILRHIHHTHAVLVTFNPGRVELTGAVSVWWNPSHLVRQAEQIQHFELRATEPSPWGRWCWFLTEKLTPTGRRLTSQSRFYTFLQLKLFFNHSSLKKATRTSLFGVKKEFSWFFTAERRVPVRPSASRLKSGQNVARSLRTCQIWDSLQAGSEIWFPHVNARFSGFI